MRDPCNVPGCETPAVVCYQSGTARFSISPKGAYKFQQLYGDQNAPIVLCQEHDTPENRY